MPPCRQHPARVLRICLFFATLLLLAFGAGGVVAFRLTHRSRRQHAEPLAALGVPSAVDVRLRTEDGLALGDWYVPGSASAPYVILLHGNGSSRAGLAPEVRLLAGDGLCLLAITLRAHGDSDGDVNDVGWSARHDVEAGVAFLERTRPGSERCVYGSSLGAAAALYAAPALRDRVRGYVLESPHEVSRARCERASKMRCLTRLR